VVSHSIHWLLDTDGSEEMGIDTYELSFLTQHPWSRPPTANIAVNDSYSALSVSHNKQMENEEKPLT